MPPLGDDQSATGNLAAQSGFGNSSSNNGGNGRRGSNVSVSTMSASVQQRPGGASSSQNLRKGDKPDNDYEDIDYAFKVAIIGDPGVGKSAILDRELGVFVHTNDNKLRPPPVTAPKASEGQEAIWFKSKTYIFQGYIVLVEFWDVPGSQASRADTVRYLDEMAGFVMVFDVNEPATLESLDSWATELGIRHPKTGMYTRPTLVLGNKTDIEIDVPPPEPGANTKIGASPSGSPMPPSPSHLLSPGMLGGGSISRSASFASTTSHHTTASAMTSGSGTSDEDFLRRRKNQPAPGIPARKVSIDTALTWTEQRGLEYYDVSAWNNENIQDAMGTLVLNVVRQIPDEFDLRATGPAIAQFTSGGGLGTHKSAETAFDDPHRIILQDLAWRNIVPRKFSSQAMEVWWRKLAQESTAAMPGQEGNDRRTHKERSYTRELEEETTTVVDWLGAA
ncbi:hypothetical protein RI367_005779 [Sorochytrium milnesiophthora]